MLSIEAPDIPFLSAEGCSQVTQLGKGVHRVVLHYGFMEQPEVPSDLALLEEKGIPFDPMRTSYFVGRNSFVSASKPLPPRWQQKLFLALSRFPASAGDFFGMPANRVVALASRIDLAGCWNRFLQAPAGNINPYAVPGYPIQGCDSRFD